MKDIANKKYWQKIAKIYSPLMERDKDFYGDICNYIIPYLSRDMNVLELACGSGQLSIPLCQYVNNWLATDFSEKMIVEANKKEKRDNLYFQMADATDLSYGDESFDCVVIANALHIMPNPEKAMQEIKRVLKKDALLCAPTFLWKEGKNNSLRKFLMSLTGFKIYKEWDEESFAKFISEFDFDIQEINLVNGGLAPVGILIAKNK